MTRESKRLHLQFYARPDHAVLVPKNARVRRDFSDTVTVRAGFRKIGEWDNVRDWWVEDVDDEWKRGGFRDARGCVPWREGDVRPEDAIRAARDAY